MYDPELDLESRYPQFVLHRADLGYARGAVFPRERVVMLHSELSPEWARCTLAHEIAHLDLLHLPTGAAHYATRQETEANRLAATRLLDLNALMRGLQWSADHRELARALSITTSVLRTFTGLLTPDERDALEDLHPRREGVA